MAEIQELIARREASIKRREKILSRFRKRFDFYKSQFREECTRKVQGVDRRQRLADFLEESGALEVASVPLYVSAPMVSLPELRNTVEKDSPARVSDSTIYSLVQSRWQSVQEGLVNYSGGSLIQFSEVNQFGFFGFCEGNAVDAASLGDWLVHLEEELPQYNSVRSFEIRSAVLGVLLFLPKFYRALGYWGSLQLSVRLTGTRGGTLGDLFTLQAGPPCPDEEIIWLESLTVSELQEGLLSLQLLRDDDTGGATLMCSKTDKIDWADLPTISKLVH